MIVHSRCPTGYSALPVVPYGTRAAVAVTCNIWVCSLYAVWTVGTGVWGSLRPLISIDYYYYYYYYYYMKLEKAVVGTVHCTVMPDGCCRIKYGRLNSWLSTMLYRVISAAATAPPPPPPPPACFKLLFITHGWQLTNHVQCQQRGDGKPWRVGAVVAPRRCGCKRDRDTTDQDSLWGILRCQSLMLGDKLPAARPV